MIDFEKLKIKRYRYWTLYLHESQCYLGRCYLALNRDGDIDPFLGCTAEEKQEFDRVMSEDIAPTLIRLFGAVRLNYSSLQNVWNHCHWHIVPRYDESKVFAGVTFTDANKGSNWSPYDKSVTLLETTLFAIRDAIAAALA